MRTMISRATAFRIHYNQLYEPAVLHDMLEMWRLVAVQKRNFLWDDPPETLNLHRTGAADLARGRGCRRGRPLDLAQYGHVLEHGVVGLVRTISVCSCEPECPSYGAHNVIPGRRCPRPGVVWHSSFQLKRFNSRRWATQS